MSTPEIEPTPPGVKFHGPKRDLYHEGCVPMHDRQERLGKFLDRYPGHEARARQQHMANYVRYWCAR